MQAQPKQTKTLYSKRVKPQFTGHGIMPSKSGFTVVLIFSKYSSYMLSANGEELVWKQADVNSTNLNLTTISTWPQSQLEHNLNFTKISTIP